MNTFFRILSYLKPYKWLTILCALFSCTFAFLEVYSNLFIENFVDRALSNKDLQVLIVVTLQYVSVATAREAVEYFQDILIGRLTGYFISDLRKDFYKKLLQLPYGYYVNKEKADVISRYVNDGERSKEALEQIFHTMFHGFATVMFIIVMFTKHFRLTLTFFLIVPGMLVIIKMFSRRIIFTGKKIQEQLSFFVMTLKDFLSGIRIIKALGSERAESKKFDKDIDNYFAKHFNNVQVRAGFEFIEGWVMFVFLTAITFYGGYEVIEGRLSLGTFTFFAVALGEVHENISDFIELLAKLQTYFYATSRMFQMVDIPVKIKDHTDCIRVPEIKGEIRFKNVYFRYGNHKYALYDINFSINPGEVVAVIGRSGSGKTTIANLILNLYSATSGKVFIDNKDVEIINERDLRRQVAIVPQEIFLFNDTIANNISYGSDVTEFDIKEAAERAFVSEFTDRMPDGLHTMVTEDGSNLSGGQRQRIAIARAIVRKPKILILDEATSALDTESTKLVSSAITSAMQGHTTFMITHKISSALKSDKIIVLEFGKIVEAGTHFELIEKNGVYRDLYRQHYF